MQNALLYLVFCVTHYTFSIKHCAFSLKVIKKEKPGKTTRPWGIPAPLLYLEEG